MFLRARQYANHAESRRHGAPVSDRHRAGARNPRQQRRPRSRGSAKPAPTTPPPTNLTAATHASPPAQNHVGMERRSPTGIARERETRTRRRYATIARERETRPNDPTPRQSHRCERRIATRAESRGHGALASSPGGGRHSPPKAGGGKDPQMESPRYSVESAPIRILNLGSARRVAEGATRTLHWRAWRPPHRAERRAGRIRHHTAPPGDDAGER